MPKGELYIKDVNSSWVDAYTTWGISFEETAISALMTPAPNKDYIENESRLEHGKRIDTSNAKKDSKDLSLEIHLSANSKDDFFSKYYAFCKVLAKGKLLLKVSHIPNVVFKTVYKSCSQFKEYNMGLAKFQLKLEEPNPDDRTE